MGIHRGDGVHIAHFRVRVIGRYFRGVALCSVSSVVCGDVSGSSSSDDVKFITQFCVEFFLWCSVELCFKLHVWLCSKFVAQIFAWVFVGFSVGF